MQTKLGLDGGKPKKNTACERADKASAFDQQLPGVLPAEGRDEVGTLASKRVDVRQSTLGSEAGLGNPQPFRRVRSPKPLPVCPL